MARPHCGGTIAARARVRRAAVGVIAMRERLIRKTAAELQVTPNLPGQDTLRAAFSWDRLRDELGAPADDFNIARLAVDRHATGPQAHRVALRFLRTDRQVARR